MELGIQYILIRNLLCIPSPRGFNQLDRHLYNLFDFLINRVGFIFFETFINILRKPGINKF
ncbi:hypothetical protein BpHYR1_001269 [Brachionus plicatilis]|uniref:Uncharacterized protein n=1 Tax=Brachionus plicatilis TaxID=10195 RepID=A0A3M7RAE9_BRAPC|nr:hypothetical protein BpHYR1_001269 [Brachionus plicatilis]